MKMMPRIGISHDYKCRVSKYIFRMLNIFQNLLILMLFKCVKNLIIDSNSFSNSIKQQYQRIFFLG